MAPSIALNSFKIAVWASKNYVSDIFEIRDFSKNMDFVFLIPIIISIIMIIITITIIIKDATLQNLRTKATLRQRGVSLFHVLTARTIFCFCLEHH